MPLSRTANCSSSAAPRPTVSATLPFSVNFTAFDNRFNKTWRSRVESPLITAGTSASIVETS